LLAEAGHPGGFGAGDYYCDSSYANLGEAVLNNLQEVGIRSQLRPIERAAFLKGWGDKAFKNLIQCGTGAFGNAATRLDTFIVKGGTYVYGSYPDIDALAPQQAAELDHKQRAAVLEQMQQLVHDKSVVAPIWQLAFINGAGPRVGESGFDLIKDFAYTGPYEDITIKGS
jgi:peptide/nickel transport system substrate-binding protein